jgi:hypothetical protein
MVATNMGNESAPESQPEQISSKAQSESREEATASASDNLSLDEGVVPTEVVEALKELPPEQRRMVSSMFLSMGRMSSSSSSALVKRVTPEHITQTLDNLEKGNERDFQKS